MKRLSPAYHFVNAREIKQQVLCLDVPGRKKRDFCAIIKVGSVSFGLMSDVEQEAVLEAYRIFLMRLSFDTVIHIRVKPSNMTHYLHQFQPPSGGDPAIASIAHEHQQFIRAFAATHTLLEREFYLILYGDEQTAFESARSQLERRCTDICRDLDRIGLPSTRLDEREIANYYLSILNTHFATQNPLESKTLASVSLPVFFSVRAQKDDRPADLARDTPYQSLPTRPDGSDLIENMRSSSNGTIAIAGRFLAFIERRKKKKQAKHERKHLTKEYQQGDTIHLADLLQPASIEVKRTYLRINTVYDEYLRFFAVTGYPRTVESGWFDRLCSLDEPYVDFCVHIHPLDAQKYIQKLTHQIIAYTGTQKVSIQRGNKLDPYISNALRDVEALRDKLVRQEENVYSIALYMQVRANSKEQLDAKTDRLYSLLRGLDLRSIPLTMRHQKALHCFLPGRDPLRLRRLLDTTSIQTAFPFTDSTLSTEQGVIRGITPNKSLVIIDPFDKSLENGHECTIGATGTGKSFEKKTKIMRSLALGINVVVLDPEGEYTKLAKKVHGSVIDFSSGQFKLNPFRVFLLSGEEDTILAEKVQSLLVLFDLLLAEKLQVLKQEEKAFLSKNIAALYLPTNDFEPSMQSFYHLLRSDNDTYHLADRLERFVPMFPEKETDNISLDAPLTVFNMRDLEDDLRDVGMFLVTMAVWSRIRRQQPSERKPRLLVIDETWRFLKLPTSAEFLVHIIRLARKQYVSVNTNIHDAKEFFASEWGQAIWNNSAIKFVLKQNSSTIKSVVDALDLSLGERRYLLSCGIGQGLLCVRGVRIPLQVIASEEEYELANTNPVEEAQEQQKLKIPS